MRLYTRSVFFWTILIRYSLLYYSEPETKCGRVHSRPLDSDDMRMIEEDLGKQLGSSPRDDEWETEPDLESFVTGMENGGTRISTRPLILCLLQMHPNISRTLRICIFNKKKKSQVNCEAWVDFSFFGGGIVNGVCSQYLSSQLIHSFLW